MFIYCGLSNIYYVVVKVIVLDGSFVEILVFNDSYEIIDLGEKIEKVDYKMGEDGNVFSFFYMNCDKKNICVEYFGEWKFFIIMIFFDCEVFVGIYELVKLFLFIC